MLPPCQQRNIRGGYRLRFDLSLCVSARSCRYLLRRVRLTSATFVTLSRFLGKPGETAQGFGHLHAATDAGDHHIDHGEGRVEVAASLKLLDWNARGRHGLGVGDAFVAQRVELTGYHECRGQARQFAAERRRARIG